MRLVKDKGLHWVIYSGGGPSQLASLEEIAQLAREEADNSRRLALENQQLRTKLLKLQGVIPSGYHGHCLVGPIPNRTMCGHDFQLSISRQYPTCVRCAVIQQQAVKQFQFR